jgi:hypothetical protein
MQGNREKNLDWPELTGDAADRSARVHGRNMNYPDDLLLHSSNLVNYGTA